MNRLTEPPQPPNSLEGVAKSYWQEMAAKLVASGDLYDVTLEPLESLCRTWEEYQHWSSWLAEDMSRAITVSPSGVRKQSAESRMAKAAHTDCQRLWKKLGIIKPAKKEGKTPELSELEKFAATKNDGDQESRI